MRLDDLTGWIRDCGLVEMPWTSLDWQAVLRLLSKLLADPIMQRRNQADIAFRISFDAMTEMAEEILGIPMLAMESDLDINIPTMQLVLLTYMACVRNSTESMASKAIAETIPPNLVFDARQTKSAGNSMESGNCAGCGEHTFLVERIAVNRRIWHRRCFRCANCGKLLRRGGYRVTAKKETFECLDHWPRSILAPTTIDTASRTPLKPIPPPKPRTGHALNEKSESIYETLELQETIPGVDASLTNRVGDSEKSEDTSSVSSVPEPPTTPLTSKRGSGSRSQEPYPKIAPKPQKLKTSPDSVPVKTENDHGSVSDAIKTMKLEETEAENTVIFRKPSEAIPDDPSDHPVAPPRPKRRSATLGRPMSTLTPKATPSPKLMQKHRLTLPPTSTSGKPENLVDYPGFLNPFGTDDDDQNEKVVVSSSSDDEYDSTLNPFGTDEENEENYVAANKQKPIPSARTLKLTTTSETGRASSSPKRFPAPSPPLPGFSSDRPKSTPPAPPKPPRPSLDSAVRTLPRSRKSRRAPPPPMPLKRKIIFTDHDIPHSLAAVTTTLEKLDCDQDRLEVHGKRIETELLFSIEQNGAEWTKNRHVEDWLEMVERKCDLLYLNDLHSDTEFQLRCMIERSQSEKSNDEVEQEAKLLELLIDIMEQKNRLIESKIDPSAIAAGQSKEGSHKTATPEASVKKKLKIRIKKLKRKLQSKDKDTTTI